MALSPKLQLRQSQSLVMTPQLMQAIKLLQLSNLDLLAYVETELERNPLLERDERDNAPDDPAAGDDAANGEMTDLVGAQDTDLGSLAQDMDAEPGDVFEPEAPSQPQPPAATAGPSSDGGSLRWEGASGGGDGDADPMALLSQQLDLRDHLTNQLAIAVQEPSERLIGGALIDLVDDAGYLRGDIDEIADRLGAAIADVERVLTICQTFEPTGVMARSLSECLALQLRERDRLDPAMAALIDNLDLVARRDVSGLRRLCGVDEDDLSDMIVELRALDPKPGLAFGGEPIQPVVPDIEVRPAADGGWQIDLNSETLPRVLVNERYQATLSSTDDAAKTFLSTCLSDANWLVKSLDQRARTIIKVATEIVRQQDAFLAQGVAHLRPLNLKTIADKIEMHESTVSRVTANKYMATPRGVFELKYFFTNAIAGTDGAAAHSSESVRHRIRSLIEDENPDRVLSDDQIVKALRLGGVDIARRTVAKYREAMGIPSSTQRRREKLVSL